MIHLEARKSLGQHFLVDPKIHERIVKVIALSAEDVLVEIGPGTGLLTRKLLASHVKKVIAFELDARAIPELRAEFESAGDRFEVREQDFLLANLHEIAAQQGSKLRVAGNIPYYITSPILFKLIDERNCLQDATLLIQKEVAERLSAAPSTKAYGIPTVLANFFGEVKYHFKVSAGSFRPKPNVDSAVVRIDFERGYFARNNMEQPSSFDEAAFRKLVRSLFAMRRKTVRNNLKAILPAPAIEQMEATDSAGFLPRRAEEFGLEEFLELYNHMTAALGNYE